MTTGLDASALLGVLAAPGPRIDNQSKINAAVRPTAMLIAFRCHVVCPVIRLLPWVLS
jgi:hypothetical protein